MKKEYIVLLLLVVGFLTFWFIFRPAQIRKACNNEALDYSLSQGPTGLKGTIEGQQMAIVRKQLYDAAYSTCIHAKGL